MKKYSAVIFDWDGTIINSTHSIVAAIQAACADLNLPVPETRDAAWVIGLSLESGLYRCVPDLTAEQMPQFLDRYRHHYFGYDPHIQLFDGMREFLEGMRARQIGLAVATGKSRVGLEKIIDQVNLRPLFDTTRTADETASKPDPTMLLEILEEMGLDTEEVIMVGDTTHDIHMARHAGVDSLAVTYGAHDPDTLLASSPGAMVSSVTDMQSWLEPRLRT
ncbi:MAG TPA: HAD-IA family hydrolase [Burkholderiaceae bacterium]|nr:HAD-IA family hydrolase [Burkholderiaceae bacterium]